MKIRAILSYITCIVVLSCNPPEEVSQAADESKTLKSWFEGKYLFSEGGAGIYFEDWTKIDSTTYTGIGNYVTSDLIDTLFSMNMKLVMSKKKATMFYDVSSKKDKKQLEFVLTSKDNNTFVFENPFHDFPSIMQYKVLADSSIEVTERGFVENKEKVRQFTIKKTN